MSKLHSRSSVSGASLSGANLKATMLAIWDALQSIGVTDVARTTVSASTTLTMAQCGIVLVDCSAGSVALTLPTSGTATDEAVFEVRRVDASYTNSLTVTRGGTDTIEGSTAAVAISPGAQASFKLPAGAVAWRVTGRTGGTQQAARDALNVPTVNHLDNPDGEVYQRGIAATADDVYMDDRWYALTQTGTIAPSQLSNPEDGYPFGIRLTQSQAAAQRMGSAQILEGKETRRLRGKTLTFGGRYRMSTSANLRMAILVWTGTEDTVTSDVVNDWTSSNYTTSNFFAAANLTVVAVSSTAMTASTVGNASVTGTIPANANNIFVLYWTEATAAQNVTLDAWGRRLVESFTLVDYIRRTQGDEVRRCQRYVEVLTYTCASVASTVATLRNYNFPLRFATTKAAAPTVTLSGVTTNRCVNGGPASPNTGGFSQVVQNSNMDGDDFTLTATAFASCDL